MSRDPILAHVVQPLVDAMGGTPRTIAVQSANLFLMVAVTLSAVRVATIDLATMPNLYAMQTMHVVGAAMVFGTMRYCATNGETSLIGALGVAHLMMRLLFVPCFILDLIELRTLVTTDMFVSPISLARSALQLTEDGAALAAIYLAVCRRPPPRRRIGRRELSPA